MKNYITVKMFGDYEVDITKPMIKPPSNSFLYKFFPNYREKVWHYKLYKEEYKRQVLFNIKNDKTRQLLQLHYDFWMLLSEKKMPSTSVIQGYKSDILLKSGMAKKFTKITGIYGFPLHSCILCYLYKHNLSCNNCPFNIYVNENNAYVPCLNHNSPYNKLTYPTIKSQKNWKKLCIEIANIIFQPRK